MSFFAIYLNFSQIIFVIFSNTNYICTIKLNKIRHGKKTHPYKRVRHDENRRQEGVPRRAVYHHTEHGQHDGLQARPQVLHRDRPRAARHHSHKIKVTPHGYGLVLFHSLHHSGGAGHPDRHPYDTDIIRLIKSIFEDNQ